MRRERDLRDFSEPRSSPEERARLHALATEVSDNLPGDHRVIVTQFDARTGNAAAIASEGSAPEPGSYSARAIQHLASIRPALGLPTEQPAEFVPAPNTLTTSSGTTVVHLHQHYKGIPIFEASETVTFAPDGSLTRTEGSCIAVPSDVPIAARLAVTAAVMEAARHVSDPGTEAPPADDQYGQQLSPPGVDITGFEPTISARFSATAPQFTVLDRGPFGSDITASLAWFPLNDELRLAWDVLLTLPEYAGQYRTLVDGNSGEVLYCRQLVQTIAARGNVYVRNGDNARQMVAFPVSVFDYGLPIPKLPQEFPDDWVTDTGRSPGRGNTEGNSVRAIADGGTIFPGFDHDNEGVVTFNPGDPVGVDQAVLNAFYYCCRLHDFFYLLGFREGAFNFQQDNFSRGGIAGDRVVATVSAFPVDGTATMFTPVDGSSPAMTLGTVRLADGTSRHTGLDLNIVVHEYMHGVSNRLVGGAINDQALSAPQSNSMGEGWSDFFGCMATNETVVGSWSFDDPTGIRRRIYDAAYRDHFGLLGTGAFGPFVDANGNTVPYEPHNVGELWCAALMEMSRRIGKNLAMQLVMDGLMLSVANPSFLHGRRKILDALEDLLRANKISRRQFDGARQGIWGAFARFGMGQAAVSNGAELNGIRADFYSPFTWAYPPGDYSGDGKIDFAVWRPGTGNWHIKDRATGAERTVQWGESGDIPLPIAFHGSKRTDFVLWRPRTGVWHVKMNTQGTIKLPDPAMPWGDPGDIPVPGDYSGDGKIDFAVWRPGTGNWHIKDRATGAERTVQWGESGDIPLPIAFHGSKRTDFVLWRPRTGVWHVKVNTQGVGPRDPAMPWGDPGDIPV